MFQIIETEMFRKQFLKIIPKNLQEDVRRRIKSLSYEPHKGKPLGNFIYEFKANKFRIYYTIIDAEVLVIMIAISSKKDQQDAINLIKGISFDEITEKYKNSRG